MYVLDFLFGFFSDWKYIKHKKNQNKTNICNAFGNHNAEHAFWVY